MRRRLYIPAVSLVLLAAIPSDGRAGERCASSCRSAVKICVASECTTAQGSAHRTCVERCRGRLGCPARIRTLAYVVARCREHDGRLVGSQELRIRRGDCDDTTVLRFDTQGDVADEFGLCRLVSTNREGFGAPLAGPFQRLGVTHDGSGVVFEVTNEFNLIGGSPLTAEQQGFFYVRADGSGLRRIGPASRTPTYLVYPAPSGDPTASFQTTLSFSPSGRLIAYTDVGPGPDGREATQVVTLDVESGQRTQVTTLPLVRVSPSGRPVQSVYVLDENTIQFDTQALGDGQPTYTIRTDGTQLRRARRFPLPESLHASPARPFLEVTRPTARVLTLEFAIPTNNSDLLNPNAPVREVFRLAGTNIVQLTSFGRYDTFGVGYSLNGLGPADAGPRQHGSRVLFVASADPLGENPFANCQIFSVDELGTDLRQLTHMDEGVPSLRGCDFNAPPGCAFNFVYRDPVTNWMVFYSNCDPFGTGHYGSEVFAMRPDGSRLRQLTHTAGARFGIDGEVEVEIVGQIAYPAPIR